jgi:uncharacterized membrane protein YgdD (TMEM256/DUF423 family)
MKPFHYAVLGCISSALAIAAGAFGAHGLRSVLSTDTLELFKTASHYQLIHGVALVAYGLHRGHAVGPTCTRAVAGGLFLAGTVLFSGSLYLLALTGIRQLGMITPFGGMGFICGWILFALEIHKGNKNG